MVNRKLIIRADASTRMGTGHVMRCIALGQAWQDAVQSSGVRGQGSVVFTCAEIPDALAERVRSEGFDLVRIDAEKGSAEDVRQTLEAARGTEAKWIITDGYHFGLGCQRAIRAAGLKLLLIDDYNHFPEYEADILLNQNIGAEEIEYRCNPDCRKLLGTKYIMLRREFRRAKPRLRSAPVRKILVTMGGSDPDNATRKIIEALNQLEMPDLEVKVIVGPANSHLESLRQAVNRSTFDLGLLPDVKDMPALLQWADFSISAAGSTCWELAALGVPFITVILAKNQEQVALKLEKYAGVPCMGWSDSELVNRLTEHCEKYFSSAEGRSAEGRTPKIDPFGVDRILRRPSVDSGIDLYKDRLILRNVTMEDAKCLFDWANDFETRKNCFTSAPIPWEEHVNWLQGKLTSDAAILFMLELDGIPCGHIRYDLEDEDEALLSFVVSPDFRGMGLGRFLVERTRGHVIEKWRNATVKAVAFTENIASSEVFEKTGFQRPTRQEIKGHLCNVYFWRRA
jgi:UDP-2,4-diacetamido-2,4,6-trideoxy-beta-L-altropyranose hydrolase